MKYYLKGGIATSINSEGLMSKETTWMLVPDYQSGNFNNWLSFENEVREFAGNIGDAYKKPKYNGKAEIDEYELDNTFLVESVSYNLVAGKTHYEVTFSNTQNLNVMQVTGNVSVDIDSSNVRTKNISYKLTIPLVDGAANFSGIDDYLLSSGDSVLWAGELYEVASSSYKAQSKTAYTIDISAKDMSYMMIGLPSIQEDAFGQRTATVTWRYSLAKFNSTILPKAGDSASDFLGDLEDKNNYSISSINIQPEGVLGYNVTYSCKYIGTRLIKITKGRNWNNENGTKNNISITYQSDADNTDDFLERVGKEATTEGFPMHTIIGADVNQNGIGDYEVTLNISNDTNRINNTQSNKPENLKKQYSISSTQSKFYLTARHCGMFRSASDLAWYPINHPPQATMQEDITPQQLKSLSSYWTDTTILTAVQSGYIGFSVIDKIYNADNNAVPKSSWSSLTINDIVKIRTVRFIYAQPNQTTQSVPFGNLFVPWVAKTEVPVILYDGDISDYPTYSDNGLDMAYAEKYIGYGINCMDSNVTMNYQGAIATIMAKDWGIYFREAVKKIDNKIFTSHKMMNVSFSRIMDSNNREWTQVNVQIKSLLEGYWNDFYDEGISENGSTMA